MQQLFSTLNCAQVGLFFIYFYAPKNETVTGN